MNYAFIIGICWIGFWVYWIASAFGSKPGRASSHVKAFFGLRLGIIAVAAATALLFDRLPQSFRDQALGVGPGTKLLGLVIFALGAGFAIWARVTLGKNWGMPMTEKRQPELVTTGPYRYARHPIYTGILAMAAGSVIDVNAYWLPVLVVGAGYFIYSAVMEERILTKQFGKIYEDYKARTKMLVPFVF